MARFSVLAVVLFLLQTALLSEALTQLLNDTKTPSCPKPAGIPQGVMSRRITLRALAPNRPPTVPAKPLEYIFSSELDEFRISTIIFGSDCEIPGGTYSMSHSIKNVGSATLQIKPQTTARSVTYGLVRDFLEEVPHRMNQYYRGGYYYEVIFYVYETFADGRETGTAWGSIMASNALLAQNATIPELLQNATNPLDTSGSTVVEVT